MNATLLISFFIAIAIPALALYLIFLLDFFGTGKHWIIGICVAWGIIGAFGLSYTVNSTIYDYLHNSHSADDSFFILSTRIAPFVEETLKGLILIYVIQQPSFLYFVDGAIYGFAAGMGFSMSENILYIMTNPDESAIFLAINRVVTASLMHATAVAVAGISLGLGRRQSGLRRWMAPVVGLFFALVVHLLYNNVLAELGQGFYLMLAAVGIGIGGSVMIGIFINMGLVNEKKHFEETLGLRSGVSAAERKAVQKMGSESIEVILQEMETMFGREKTRLIRRMLIIQANIGILNNNLKSPAGERLKKAWQEEIDHLRAEMDEIRSKLGTYAMTLLRSLLPEDEEAVWTNFGEKVAEYDPSHVHSFDLFMVASRLTETLAPELIEQLAEQLQKIEIFKNVALVDLDNLARAVMRRRYSHGQMLFDKGDEGDTMYMIHRGYINIYLIDDDSGEQKFLRTYDPGDVVGELALLDGIPRSARARANGPLSVMVLQRKHFMMFCQSRPRVILAVLRFLTERVRYTTNAVFTQPMADKNVLLKPELEGEAAVDHEDRLFDEMDNVNVATGNRVSGLFTHLEDMLGELPQLDDEEEA